MILIERTILTILLYTSMIFALDAGADQQIKLGETVKN